MHKNIYRKKEKKKKEKTFLGNKHCGINAFKLNVFCHCICFKQVLYIYMFVSFRFFYLFFLSVKFLFCKFIVFLLL